MGIEFNEMQKKAISAKGNVLVSAAAGSGKTAVLTRRVVDMLCDKENGITADKLLIVTFTNAAAAEMRGRIELLLDAECANDPDNEALILQRQLLSSAKICTIDSFCIDLVRENFERLNVSPDFKIAEQSSLASINEQTLSELLKEYYKVGDPEFFHLMDIVGAEYDDGDFSSYVLKLFEYSRQLAFPEEFFISLSDMYNPEGFNKENRWYSYAVEKAKSAVAYMQSFAANILDALREDEKAHNSYAPFFINIAGELDRLKIATESGDWDDIFTAFLELNADKFPRANGPLGRAAKATWDGIFELRDGVLKIVFDTSDNIKKQLGELYSAARLLSEILLKLELRLFSAYTDNNILTFHNTEHLALKLLTEKNEKGEIIPTDIAEELAEQFSEVMVDEYQDTNELQDTLFYMLSGKGKRLFAVGDAKQSIYGFRGAEPKNFTDKVNNAKYYDSAEEGDAKKIILGNNYRSRKEICDFANYFFSGLMKKETGGIDYNADEYLLPTAEFPETEETPVTFDIIVSKGSAEDNLRAEARQIAVYIKSVMSAGNNIRTDKDTMRSAKYSDFAILLRNTKYKSAILSEELKKCGIPVNFSAEGYAEATEIAVFLSLLKVIDNPENDIELLSVIMSPIFGFNANDVAEIRISRRKGSLYSSLVFAAQNGNGKAQATIEKLEKYRMLSVILDIPRLISRLFKETDYLNFSRAMLGGEKRYANLLLLISYAEQYSSDNVGSLGGFVKYILKQSENGMKSAAVASDSDTVKIMSIHASKGLQFPVTIIAGMANSFNDNDAKNSALYSESYGIGFKYFDEEREQKRTTVGREVILDSIRTKTRTEELRLLYVAMTRAEDKLHFTATVGDVNKGVKAAMSALIYGGGNAYGAFNKWKSYYEWLLVSALLHPDGKLLRDGEQGVILSDTESRIKITVTEPPEINSTEDIKEELPEVNKETVEKIKNNISYKYPFEDLLRVEAKSSVSALANKAESEKYAFSVRPSFMSEGGITAAERGTATHKIIEFIDFSKADNLEDEINRLYEWQFISEREAESVNRETIKKFFQSDLFKRILLSKTVKREMRFLTELPVSRVDPSLEGKFPNETVVVQGAVDLCFEEEGEIVVVDFKTDRTDSPERLIEAYSEQLNIYSLACEKIFEKRVKEKIIYSLSLSKAIKL